jgi:hypothetical protein
LPSLKLCRDFAKENPKSFIGEREGKTLLKNSGLPLF